MAKKRAAAKRKKTVRRKKAPVRRKAVRRTKAARKPPARKTQSRRKTARRRSARPTAGFGSFAPDRGLGPESAGQSGDTEGLSRAEIADSESVEELVEEGQAFEAGIVSGVENARNADEGPVR